MKICLSLISDGWGGAEKVVHELASEYINRGFFVIIIINQEIVHYFQDIRGIKILNIGSVYNHKCLICNIFSKKTKEYLNNNIDTGAWYIINDLLRTIYYYKISNFINNELIKNDIKFIHSNLENSDILVGLCITNDIIKISTIHGLHIPSLFIQCKIKLIPRIAIKIRINILLKSISRFNHITFVSEWNKKQFTNLIQNHINTSVIKNGVNLRKYNRIIFRKISNDHTNMIFPGGNKLNKGIVELLEAIPLIKKEIPNIHLYIAGATAPTIAVSKIITDLGIESNISYMGQLRTEDYIQLLCSMDLICLPSHNEGTPLSLIEAMALGIPIIASNEGGIPEIIVNKNNGILVDVNPVHISSAVIFIINNPNIVEQIKNNNQEIITDFDWYTVVNKYILLYNNLLDN